MKEVLENLGYKLIDNGNHWRTSALYRDGDNATALQIYKDSGVWKDYVNDSKPKPFEALIKLTLRGQPQKLEDTLKSISSGDAVLSVHETKTLIEMEKIYDNDILEKLFPNYNFYSKRKISEQTQKDFKVGLAGAGNMYRRMVFPIYNIHKQIVGFSGRRVDNNDYAKWKHIGKKNNWIYPSFIPNEETVDSIIHSKKSVYLTESIGDAMALYDQGIKNVIVIFGLSVSSNIISYLSGITLDKIIIAGNNDLSSKDNRGLMGSIKNYLKLSRYFDLDILSIKLPPNKHNDIGDAHEDSCDLFAWSKEEVDIKKQRQFISNFVARQSQKFSKSDIKKARKLNE